MGSIKFRIGRNTIHGAEVSDSEIGEILIGLRDISVEKNLDRTSEAIRTALNILFYETRVNSGQVKFARKATPSPRKKAKKLDNNNAAARLQKLVELRSRSL